MTGNRILSERQMLFCKYYAESPWGTKAARKAVYTGTGAKVRACRLLKLERIQAEINRLKQEQRGKQIKSNVKTYNFRGMGRAFNENLNRVLSDKG